MNVNAVALQLPATFGEPDKNLSRFSQAVRSLEGKVDLVVAPELLNSGYDLAGLDDRGAELAEPLSGPTVTLAAELAAERQATVVVGMLEHGDDGLLYDTAVVVGRDGAPTPYRKTHLYPPEEGRFARGGGLTTVRSEAGRVGVMICFEHAFPDVATALALDGAQILAIPSAVPFGYEHLLTLRSRARAQDNQVFVVASNLVGGRFCGHSLIVDPRGAVLAEAGTQEGTISAVLDLDLIDAEREREPALRLRRPELYR